MTVSAKRAPLLPAPDADLPGRGLAWLERLRREGRDVFEERGLPGTGDEDWRFTDVGALAEAGVLDLSDEPAPGPTPEPPSLDPEAHVLCFRSGRLDSARSRLRALPDGARVGSLVEALRDDPEGVASVLGSCVDTKARSLTALNTAAFADGVFVDLDPGVRLAAPIHLVFIEPLGAPLAAHPRNLFRVGERSQVTIVEHYLGSGAGGGLTNAVSELLCGAESRVDHVSLQEQASQSFHLAELSVRQERQSELRSCSLALGARLARLEIRSVLAGEGARASLLGAYFARDRQHTDHHTTIDHAVPRTTSRELYKGILNDHGHGVFHGRIHVRPDAQKIDANQTNRALLLSEHARINTKPQLEIYADDVRCSHGASIGRLDADQLFYLRSRGIEREDARALLTLGFASEVLSQLPLATLGERVNEFLRGWLSEGER